MNLDNLIELYKLGKETSEFRVAITSNLKQKLVQTNQNLSDVNRLLEEVNKYIKKFKEYTRKIYDNYVELDRQLNELEELYKGLRERLGPAGTKQNVNLKQVGDDIYVLRQNLIEIRNNKGQMNEMLEVVNRAIKVVKVRSRMAEASGMKFTELYKEVYKEAKQFQETSRSAAYAIARISIQLEDQTHEIDTIKERISGQQKDKIEPEKIEESKRLMDSLIAKSYETVDSGDEQLAKIENGYGALLEKSERSEDARLLLKKEIERFRTTVEFLQLKSTDADGMRRKIDGLIDLFSAAIKKTQKIVSDEQTFSFHRHQM